MKIFSPLPGEYIASALKRGNELLDIRSIATEDFYIKPIPRVGFGISKCETPLKAEWRDQPKFKFPEFLTKHNISENVLANHTLHPLNAALGRSRAYTEVTPKTWMRICPECVLDDLEKHGSAYIHCRHVPPTVMACSIHHSVLIASCPHCTIDIRKHDITKLGKCSRRYKYSKLSKTTKNHTSHSYAKFVADLLGYRGEMAGRNRAEAIIHQSVLLKYGKDRIYPRSSMGMAKVIERELGISINLTNNEHSIDRCLSLFAFLGCRTAEYYLELLANENVGALLGGALDDARIDRFQPY